MSQPNPREVITTKALGVWVAAVAVYIVAITGRTSFGVAGLPAMERFGVDAASIAVFTTVQVGVYAAAQIPTGLLIDRFGPRRLLVIGAIIMGLGQLILGLTTTYWVAIAARVLIGAGDATAFLSVMRILPYWFPLHRTPMFTQVTSSLGQLGQFVSAVPFLAMLNFVGWAPAFITLGAVGILIAIASAVAVADAPEGFASEQPNSQRYKITEQLAVVLRSPVAWQAFFVHFSGLMPVNVFILLWGMPLMVEGLGLSEAQAGTLLTINTIALIFIGPLHGRISARARDGRDFAALGFVLFHLAAWTVFFWLADNFFSMLIMGLIMALCGPAANYGFDIVRENLDHRVVATATGLANMGGFLSTMVAAQIMGIMLSQSGHSPNFEFADFRFAALGVLAVWLVGMTGILVTHFLRRGNTGPSAKIVSVS